MSRRRSKTWLRGRLLVRVLEGVRERGRRKGLLADEVLRESGGRAGNEETMAVVEGVSSAGVVPGVTAKAVVRRVLLLLEMPFTSSVSLCSGSLAC